jgi:predicted transcriptional regulator
MKRTTIWLKSTQIRELRSLARDTGAAVASLIRKAVDEFIDRRRALKLQKEKTANGEKSKD